MGNILIKVLLDYFPPLLLAGGRFFIASLVFFAVAKLQGLKLPREPREVLNLLVLGLAHTTMLNGFRFLALDLTGAGKVAVFFNTQALFVALFAPHFVNEQRFGLAKSIGLATGFAGVLAIFAGDVLAFSLVDLFGAFFAALGALSWTVGTFWVKRLPQESSLTLANGIQMLAGSFPLLALGFTVEGIGRVTPSNNALLLLGLLIALCTCVAYILWFKALKAGPAGIISSFNFLSVVFTVTMGVFLLHEPASLVVFLGAALVSAGIFIVNRF